MSNILAVLTTLDPLAILFLVGSLAFLWATVHVLVNELDLEKPEAGRKPTTPSAADEATTIQGPMASAPTAADEAATTREPIAASAPPPVPPSRPTGTGGRKAA